MKINLTQSLLLAGTLLPCFAQAQEAIYVQQGAGLTVQHNALLAVQGSVRLENGSTLKNDGVIAVGHTQSMATADWMDGSTAPYHYGTGQVCFASTGRQSVSTGNAFGSLEVNNAGLQLGTTVSANRWILTNGEVNTHSHLAVALDKTATAVKASAANAGYKDSWFNGTLRRFLSAATVDQYTFPVGNQHRAFVAILDNLTANPLDIQYLDVAFATKPGSDMGLSCIEDNSSYSAIRNEGVWKLKANKEQIAGAYDIRLSEEAFGNGSLGSLGIVVRELSSNQAAAWTVPHNASTSSRSTVDGLRFIQRKNLSVLGQFGLGVLAEPASTGTIVTAGPNPATNQLRLHTSKPVQQLKGYVSTSNGTVVKMFVVQNNGLIQLSDLKAGTYLITIPDLDGPGKAWQQKILLVK